MPMQRFPLVGAINRRPYIIGTTVIDQRFVACYPVDIPNPETGSKAVYCVKRAGLTELATTGAAAISTGNYSSPSLNAIYSAFGASNSTIYQYNVSGVQTTLGTVTGLILYFSECMFSSITYILMTSSDKTCWFWASDATDTTISGDTHTNTVIDNITGLTGSLYVGQKITGTGIQAGTRIASITSATAITTTIATTATATVTITVELIAKIIDADFPTDVVGFMAEMEGFVYVMGQSGTIWNSDLNSVTAWTATSKLLADSCTDAGRGVIKYKNMIAAFGTKSVEFYENQGNPFGSPLKRVGQTISEIGVLSESPTVGTRPLYCNGFDTVFFIGGDGNLYVLNVFSAKKLTTTGMINSGNISTDDSIGHIQAFSHASKRFINLSSEGTFAGNAARWYDIDTGIFTEPGFTNATFMSTAIGNSLGYDAIATDRGTSGKIFYMSPARGFSFLDNGAAFTMTIQTTKIDHGSEKRKFVTRVDLVADNSTGTVTLEYSDDDYTTWTTAGTFDMTQSKKSIYRLGSHTGGRAYRITDTRNAAFRGQFLDIYYSEASA